MAPTRNRRTATRSLAVAAALSGGAIALTACTATPVHLNGSPTPASTATTTTTAVPTHTTSVRAGTTPPSSEPARAAVGWCDGHDLEMRATEEVSPVRGDRLFAIHFAARSGTSCTIGGTLSDVTFAAHDGAPLAIEIGGGEKPDYTEINLDDHREAVVYIRTAADDGSGLPVATIGFTLPGKGTRGDIVAVPWPAPIDGPVQLTNLMAPVS
ncbi:hypothetical protein FHS29_004898 [Saccharothrix tamanrassetensis]|uniref:DUF4232 domain-containing protein n=1 Tax=Saccharothrix tamanrassetensis TaxID=1051531 RepID=A0A841CME4_9PSEU|nr:hypothetical protein [Saccharothrix tamanrassetensis]MBB5958290.1 hypothetical protein [Saccharothrix tamanrassetensis]